MSSVSDDQPVDPDRLACIRALNFTEWLFIIWLGNYRLPQTLDKVRLGVVGVVREDQKHTVIFPSSDL